MLETLKKEETEVNEKNVDNHPDNSMDVLGNPVSAKTIMACGKHKGMEFYKIYVDDKNYIKWVRTHINDKSASEMKKFRVFVEFTDVQKKDRLQNQHSDLQQTPITPRSKKGQVRARPREQDQESKTRWTTKW